MNNLSINQLARESGEQLNNSQLYQLKFYADSKDYKNKLFTFKVVSFIDCGRLLYRFESNGNHIRSVFLVYVNVSDGSLFSVPSDTEVLKIPFFMDCDKKRR